MRTGYAFMFKKDADTIIAHKYRGSPRQPQPAERGREATRNLYGTFLVRDHDLKDLHDAILRREHSFAYEFPRGNPKRSGIAPIDDASFGWIVGVGIDDADIFRPIARLKWGSTRTSTCPPLPESATMIDFMGNPCSTRNRAIPFARLRA